MQSLAIPSWASDIRYRAGYITRQCQLGLDRDFDLAAMDLSQAWMAVFSRMAETVSYNRDSGVRIRWSINCMLRFQAR